MTIRRTNKEAGKGVKPEGGKYKVDTTKDETFLSILKGR
jgi:hypothetical protein